MIYDLNNIEHNILRKNYDEPRIHFAINCASISCPKLRREAYTGGKLEEQLNEQTIAFINDSGKNVISAECMEISKLFSWFSGDFENDGTVIDYINRYSRVSVNANAEISYKSYDWSLNDVR